jgi:hypothetical protein
MFAYLFIWPNYSDREEKARLFFSAARLAIPLEESFRREGSCCLVLAHEGPISNHDFLVGILFEQGARDGALRVVQHRLVECGCPEPQEAVLAPVNALTTAENWADQLGEHGLTIIDAVVLRHSESMVDSPWASDSEVDSRIDFRLFDDRRGVITHICSDIAEFLPSRVLIISAAKLGDAENELVQELKSRFPQHRLYLPNQPSLSWLCETAEQVRCHDEPAIILSNYPRKTEPPSTTYSTMRTGLHTVSLQGASLRLFPPGDDATRMAVYIVGLFAIGYYRSVYRSQARLNEQLLRVQALIRLKEIWVEPERLKACSDQSDRKRILIEMANELENDKSSGATRDGGILVE